MKADLELVAECKAGQLVAFSELVQRHQRALLRLCLRLVRDLPRAEDVVQESLVKAYQKIHLFEGRSSFKNWLFQIAVNTAKNRMRSVRSNAVDIETVDLMVPSEAHQSMEKTDLKEFVRKYVDQLPEKQRTALVLRVFEDLSFKEIAKIMNCPYDTAKANYRHAIMKLRHQFAEDEFFQDWDSSESEENTNYGDTFMNKRYAEVDQ